MISGYTKNESVQILIALLEKHNIRKVIVSPGGTNLEFTAGLQYNGNFEMYSSIDERSAAYMACGMAAAHGEPVAIACTESTASREYYPGITEAFYRKLPVLAITGVHRYSQIGHLKPQIIDRSCSPVDTFRLKVHLPVIKDMEDKLETELKINRAILELTRNGGGPVHIDLPCCNNDYDFSVKELLPVRVIRRYQYSDVLPEIPNGKIAVFIGSHMEFSSSETNLLDGFCEVHDAVVFVDHTSGYKGKYRVHTGLAAAQSKRYEIFENIELLIHIGEAAGDENVMKRLEKVNRVWRISEDGELRDTFGKLENVFWMRPVDFFSKYGNRIEKKGSYLEKCKETISKLNIPYDELPFSNVYVAARMTRRLPEGSSIHLGLSNTIRAWTMFTIKETVKSYSNVGCRGIDGVLSSFIGAAISQRNRLHFCVVGDLTFFYDMNVLGNRDIGKNIRIVLINNNGGGVFKLDGAPGHFYFGDKSTDKFIAAAGHFGNQSSDIVKNYVESLGFEYMTSKNKQEFDGLVERFVSPELYDAPILFEIFVDDESEREAFKIMKSIDSSMRSQAKNVAKSILGANGVTAVKKIFR